MKRHPIICLIVICLIVVFLLLLLGGVRLLFKLKDLPKPGTLKINGVEIAQENVMIYSNYAELPLTKVMENLGMKVDWVDSDTAEITYEDKKYILTLSKVLLVEVGDKDNFNFIMPPPGGHQTYTVLEQELLLDSGTIKSAMFLMGRDVAIRINHEEQAVYIYERIE